MRSIRDNGLSLLLGGLVMVAGACTGTNDSDRPEQTGQARPAPSAAKGADETFAPTDGNRLANDDDANGSARPAAGDAAAAAPAEGDAAAADRPNQAATSEARTAASDRAGATPASGEAPTDSRDTATPAPITRTITVPEGTSLPLVLTSAVASDSSQVEDPVSARLASAVAVDGTTVIPEGAAVRGTVSEVRRSGRVKGLARLGIRFHTLVIGERSYDIRTAPVSRQAKGTVKKDTQKVAIPAAAGGVIGAIAGGGKGAAIGAAAGAAAGTGAVLATRGEEVRLASGSRVTTTLSAPLDVTVKDGS